MRSKIRLPTYLVELLQSINFSATNHERKMKFDELVNRISKFNSINTKYTKYLCSSISLASEGPTKGRTWFSPDKV